ncbi:MAG TPA: hypothetical protein VMJ65_24380 [Solirubrobacteraceae bacterium]|nr:hypothetical protein [Solirubrobacteraceae bacterium]
MLLSDRVAAVRTELLEIAVMLEGVDDLDATWIRTVDKLLTDGCESPLYNPDIHISELQATLYYLRGEKAWHRPRPLAISSPPAATDS